MPPPKGTRGNACANPCSPGLMDRPKQMYLQSEAQRLTDHPCPTCGKRGRIDRNLQDDMGGSVNSPVAVMWRCEDKLCEGADGFWIEKA